MYPYKYFSDEQKLVWEKKFISQKETKTIEIDFKDIERVRFLPGSWICDVSSMKVYSKNKTIHVGQQLVNALPDEKYNTEYEILVCTVLDKIRNNRDVKYSKGHLGFLLVIATLWTLMPPTAFFSWQLLVSFYNKGDMLLLPSSIVIACISTVVVLLGPLFIIRLIPKRINPEHILKYSPKVLFNRRYRKFIYEETGVKID